MKLLVNCEKCGSSCWRIYISLNKIQCHECLTVYRLSDLSEVKVEHQR